MAGFIWNTQSDFEEKIQAFEDEPVDDMELPLGSAEFDTILAPQHGLEHRWRHVFEGVLAAAASANPDGGDGATVQCRTEDHDDAAWRDSSGIPERDP